VCGGGDGVGGGVVEVEAGEGAEGAGLESRLGVGERRGGGELGACFCGAVGAGEQEAEGDVRSGEGGVGDDGGAVTGLGSCGLFVGGCWLVGGCWRGVSESFEGEAEVVEDLRVIGRLGVEVGENFESGGEVAGGERVIRLLDESSLRRGRGIGMGEVLSGEAVDEGGAEGCDERETMEAGLRCVDWRGRSLGAWAD
jgi:hypothetical protein